MLRCLPVLAALAVAASGCGAPVERAASGPEARVSYRTIAALTDSLAAGPTARRRAVVERAFVRIGASPVADGRGPGVRFGWTDAAPVTAALIPGRHPLGRPELVVLGTSFGGPGAPAVLEAARVLVERSTWTLVPERTVEVVLWTSRWDDRQAVGQVLRAPIWPREAIRAVLVVGADSVVPRDGLTVETIAPGAGGAALAEALVDRVVALAKRSTPPTDTLAVP